MRRLLAVVALVAVPVLAPLELADTGSPLGLPDPEILVLFGTSTAALALGLWRRRRAELPIADR